MKRAVLLTLAVTPLIWCQRQLYPAAKDGGTYMQNYYLPPAPSSYPWSPSWAPDGKSITISLLGSIWKVNPGTGDADQLTYDKTYHSSPNWSPDGKWILYTSDDNNRRIQLRILSVASGESRTLTDDDHLYLDPVFSPDGRRVAYVSTYPNGHFNIYVRAIENGAWSGPPIALTSDHAYRTDRLYVSRFDGHIEPAWTKD